MRASGSVAGLSAFSADHAVTPTPSLTPRETAVLEAYARAGDQRQAAYALGLTLRSVKSYLTRAYAKLDVTTCIAAFRVLGWLHVPEVAA